MPKRIGTDRVLFTWSGKRIGGYVRVGIYIDQRHSLETFTIFTYQMAWKPPRRV